MMQLHHFSHQVAEDSKELVVELFTSKLGFREVFRIGSSVFLRQGNASVDIQFVGSSAVTAQTNKTASQIAFISDTPREDIQALQTWFHERGHECVTGDYDSDDPEKQLWFDVPGVFLDFVIEVLQTQLLREVNYPPSST